MTMWWPNPDALQELTIEETTEGFALSAPEGTECAKWLNHFNQNEDLRQEFNKAFLETLLKHTKKD